MNNKCPQGWEETTLEDICFFSRGLTYSKKDEVFNSKNIVLRANNISLETNSLNFDELKYLNPNFIIPEEKKVKKNTIMMCISSGSKSHLGKVAHFDKDYNYAFGGFMGLLIPKENINSKWLYYLLISPAFKYLIGNLTDGANINNLKYDDIKLFRTFTPSLIEQQRIVKILDEAFRKIDKAKQNAEQNLKNAKEFFESKLNNLFANNHYGWKTNKLSYFSKLKQSKEEVRKSIANNELVTFAPMECLGINQKYFNSSNYKTLEDVCNKYVYFAENDIILAKITPCFENGKIGIAKNLKNKIGFGSSEYIVLRPSEELNNEYLYYYLNRDSFRLLGSHNMTGAVGHKRVSKDFLENYNINYPIDIKEQQKIVQKLDTLQEKTNQLEQIYQQKIKDLDELKQSILQKAFCGEL